MRLGLPILATGSVAMAAASVYYSAVAVRSQWLGRTCWRGRTDTNSVALTFDDGPSPDTEGILDVLAKYNLSATFFMVGREVESFPGIAQRVLAEGHEVGNHSYSHPSYLFQRAAQTHAQIRRAQSVIAETIGVRPQMARPPYGVRTPAYFRAARALDLQTVQWDVAGFDWKRITPRQIADNVLRKAQPGSIILLHDGDSAGKNTRKNTVDALPLIIKGLRDRDLQIAPLSQLLPEKIYEPTKGKRIHD
ncbi:MAG: peptidoglycan-N-acetylglucosamine deacetylase [Blastocatellia bacterium]|jgi:peptidoglycan/xylan/chitin deacetylase (PgdA/CDA1 family)|nr:peptidoglycan-N-acetylglucosamine deacetylase [Blastocatellia bacterium]